MADPTLLHVLDREVQAAAERRLFPLGEAQLVQEGGESLIGVYPDKARLPGPCSDTVGVIEGIYYGYSANQSTLVIYPLSEPRNCTEIELPGDFAFISADSQELFVATKDQEVLRFRRTAVGGVEFVDRCGVDGEVCASAGRFIGTSDGRVYQIHTDSAECGRLKKARVGMWTRELWRPMMTRVPVVRTWLKSKIEALAIGPEQRLWVSQGGSVWVLDAVSGEKLGTVDVAERVVKVFPVEGFKNVTGGCLVVLANGTRKFLSLEKSPFGTRLVVVGTRLAEPKAGERKLEVVDAALANDTTVVMLGTFLDKRSGVGMRGLGLVIVASETARTRREEAGIGVCEEIREVWEWRTDLFEGENMGGPEIEAWLINTSGSEPRSNVTADFKHPEKLPLAVVATDKKGGLWRAKLSVRATTKIVRKFLGERNLHSLRQTVKRLGPEVVASELFELIGNFSDVFSLAPKNADREISIAAGKILFSPDLAKALELIDPLNTIGNFPEVDTAGFGYVDPHAAGFSLKAMSPRLWGFLRIAGDALRTVWTRPLLRRDAIGNFWSCQEVAVLQAALGSLTAMENFGQQEVARFCLGVTPAEEELLRKFLDQAGMLVQWLSVVMTLELLPTETAGAIAAPSQTTSPATWSLRDLLMGSDVVAKELWTSGNLPEISAPRVFHEKLLAEVSAEKILVEEKISGRQIFQCEKLIGTFLMESPKFATLAKLLADRGSLRGVLEILLRKFRVAENSPLDSANLAISVLLERLRSRCLSSPIPSAFPGFRHLTAASAPSAGSSRSSLPSSAGLALAVPTPGALAVPELQGAVANFASIPLLDDSTEEPWQLLCEILRILISSVPSEAFHVALTKWLMLGNLGRAEILRPLIATSPKFITAYLRKKFPVTLLDVMGDDETRVVEETRNCLGKTVTRENFSEKSSLVKMSLALFPENSALLEFSRKLAISEELLKSVEEIPSIDWTWLFDACRERNLWRLAATCCLLGNLAKDDVHLMKRLVELALRDCDSKVLVEELVVKWAREVPSLMNTVVDALAKNLYMAGGTLSVFDVLMGDTELSRHAIFKAVLMEEVVSDVKDRDELSLAVVEQWIEELERKKRTEKTEIVLYLADMDDLTSRGFQIDHLRQKARHLLSSI